MSQAGDTTAARRWQIVVDGIHAPARSSARSVVVEGDTIVWVGDDPDDAPPTAERVELPGAWLTPGFVDAHVHATATGLKLDGIDLTGCASAREMLDRVRAFVAARDDDPVVGSGWDDHGWASPQLPTAADLTAAAAGRQVLLDRVDGHSCLVDEITLAGVDRVGTNVHRDDAGAATGWLREDAAGDARAEIWRRLTPQRLARARGAAAGHAASLGITSMHEMGNPALSTFDDALAWAYGDWPVGVPTWWADIDPSDALEHKLRPGGDLFLDGAIGSRTAAVTGGYRDGPALGGLFYDDVQVAHFFVRCTRERVGGAVHAIGDQAIEQAITAIEHAAEQCGAQRVRACRHRIEHVELPRPDHPRRMAALGVVASMQPAFDALWGGDDQLYASRFGIETARASNPFAAFSDAGCRLAFGSDSTVTPMAPWAGVAAASAHLGGQSIIPRAALEAATVGGGFVAHRDDTGTIDAGKLADVAMWDGDPLDDPSVPRGCLLTVHAGRITHSSSAISLCDSLTR